MLRFICYTLLSLAPAIGAIFGNDSQSLLWGPYRPNLYFGLRPRLPHSLMTGLMWFGAHDYQSIHSIRHMCDQTDGLDSYTWTHFEPRRGGVQVLKDGRNNIQITTELLKVPGGDKGGSWAVRIRGEPMTSGLPHTSALFYIGLEGLGELEMDSREFNETSSNEISFPGSSPDLGEFVIRIVGDKSPTHYLGRAIATGKVWRAEEIVVTTILERANEILLRAHNNVEKALPHPSLGLRLPNHVEASSNLFVIQKFFQGSFQFDVFFESSNRQRLDSATLESGISELVTAYNAKFRARLPVQFPNHSVNIESLENFSKAITSNLFGGIGYFYGPSIISDKSSYEWDSDSPDLSFDIGSPRLTEARSLFTATPSRSFFPRGFYWDEGFHLLHIMEWDVDLSLNILKSWLDLVDDNGWVAREQILGEEARSKVPEEFQAQVPQFANPPTLVMAITALVARITAANISNAAVNAPVPAGSLLVPVSLMDHSRNASASLSDVVNHPSPDSVVAYLRSVYGQLTKHYNWFRRTQKGYVRRFSRVARSRTEAYRWRGRSKTHVLTSGMDDYPRGPPHVGELHLDLICWMGFFTRTMADVAGFIGEEDDEASFREIETSILGNIEDLHWNEEQQMFCDCSVDQNDEPYHTCHKGYLSLFPFLLSLLPPSSSHVGAILDLLHDPRHLWSPFGLRSLSASHPDYGKGEDYWKGAIWVQMNYLALRALNQTYAVQEGPFKTRAKIIYRELRENVVHNVFKQYEQTGYVWEQYDGNNGAGRRSHPFTGWTSLVALILAEKY